MAAAAAAAVAATLGVGFSLVGAISKAMTKDDQQGCLGGLLYARWLVKFAEKDGAGAGRTKGGGPFFISLSQKRHGVFVQSSMALHRQTAEMRGASERSTLIGRFHQVDHVCTPYSVVLCTSLSVVSAELVHERDDCLVW